MQAVEPPALFPDAGAFRLHEPRELLADGERIFETDDGIELAAWQTAVAANRPTAGDSALEMDETSAAEPLSRIQWPEADTGVDAGATLRGIAEGAGLVLALAVVGLWALRQWLVKRSLVEGAGRNLKRIDSLSLPQRCHVHLLEVQGRRVLVAIDTGGVKGVTVLPDSFDALIDQPPEEPVPATDNARRMAATFTEPHFA